MLTRGAHDPASGSAGGSQRTLQWRLRRFRDISARERTLFLEAFAYLALARLAILLLPCRWTTSWMGVKGCESPRDFGAGEEPVVRAVAGAILRASRYTPWRSLCLPQALTAKAMLRKRGIATTVYLGVARDQLSLKAHAWTRSGRVTVTGAAAAREHTAVASFADR